MADFVDEDRDDAFEPHVPTSRWHSAPAPNFLQSPLILNAALNMGAQALRTVMDQLPQARQRKEQFVTNYTARLRQQIEQHSAALRQQIMDNPVAALYNLGIPNHEQVQAFYDDQVRQIEDYMRFSLGLPPAPGSSEAPDDAPDDASGGLEPDDESDDEDFTTDGD